jgi:hypothetical protein
VTKLTEPQKEKSSKDVSGTNNVFDKEMDSAVLDGKRYRVLSMHFSSTVVIAVCSAENFVKGDLFKVSR